MPRLPSETPPHPPPEPLPQIAQAASEPNPVRKLLKLLGPGFVTGVADDDPSSIGTYAVAGASLGLATLWTALLTFPFLAGVQNICARIGMSSGMGVSGVIRRRFSRWVLYPAVFALLVANTITIGADLGGIADAVRLFVDLRPIFVAAGVAVLVLVLQLFAGYRQISGLFKAISFVVFAYVLDAFVVGNIEAGETLRATFIPTLSLDRHYVTTLVAIVGTIASPYIFFWQSAQEVEEAKSAGILRARRLWGARRIEVRYRTIDINIGMGATNLIMYFTILATALTLHGHGITHLRSGADAARALQPLAGAGAGLLFAAGMIGTGLLAVPILATSSAYALAEAFEWPRGLDARWWRARGFYGAIIVGIGAGAAINVLGINPIAALFWSSVLNGIIAPPLLALIMVIARDKSIMGRHRIGPLLALLGWATVAGLSAAVMAMLLLGWGQV